MRWVSDRHWGAGTALSAAFAAVVFAVGWLVRLKGLAWGSEAGSIGCFLLAVAAFILSLGALAFLWGHSSQFDSRGNRQAACATDWPRTSSSATGRARKRQQRAGTELGPLPVPLAEPRPRPTVARCAAGKAKHPAAATGAHGHPARPRDFERDPLRLYHVAPTGLSSSARQGAGKSMLAIQLARELLACPRRRRAGAGRR